MSKDNKKALNNSSKNIDYLNNIINKLEKYQDKKYDLTNQEVIKYAKKYMISTEELKDYSMQYSDLDLAAMAIMNETNYSKLVKKIPNCLNLLECDIPINRAVETYSKLLEERGKIETLLRYAIEEQKENKPIRISKNVFYNILMRKDMEPSTKNTTLTEKESNFISALISIIENENINDIDSVLSEDELIGLFFIVKSDNKKETLNSMSTIINGSRNNYISFDKRTLQILITLLSDKKISKSLNTKIFNELQKTKQKEQQIEKGYTKTR